MERKDFLSDVPADKAFWFKNGSSIRSIYELSKELSNIDVSIFIYHCDSTHDDFANWIGGSLEDIELSHRLRGVTDKARYIRIINARIKHLERQNISKNTNKIFSEKVRSLIKDYSHIWLFIVIIIFCIIFTSMIYFEYHSLMSIRTLDEKINYIDQRNSCFNNYFNEQILTTKDLLGNRNQTTFANQCVLNYTASLPADIQENNPATLGIGDVGFTEQGIYINISNVTFSIFGNSSSMIPVLNHNSKAIETKPRIIDLHRGDIISYNIGEEIIVHRIIDLGTDDEGFYAITKGDNNDIADPNKVRFGQIVGKVVIIIY